MNAPSWRDSRFKRAQVALIAALGHPLIAALCWTLRWRVEGLGPFAALAAGDHPPILALWHGRILPAVGFFRPYRLVVITSQNFDGEWIARIIERSGYGTARGSSSRNAGGALRQLMKAIRSGRGTALTLDGPRGPAGVAKSGASWLSMATGSPIVPCHLEARRFWTMKSWDGGQIPRPFTTVAVVLGEPVYVPRDAGEVGIEASRRQIEGALAELRARALALVREDRA